MKALIVSVILALGVAAHAQTNRFPPINIYTGDPTGVACTIPNGIVQSSTNGSLYSCVGGVYVNSASAGAGGTNTQAQFNNNGVLGGSAATLDAPGNFRATTVVQTTPETFGKLDSTYEFHVLGHSRPRGSTLAYGQDLASYMQANPYFAAASVDNYAIGGSICTAMLSTYNTYVHPLVLAGVAAGKHEYVPILGTVINDIVNNITQAAFKTCYASLIGNIVADGGKPIFLLDPFATQLVTSNGANGQGPNDILRQNWNDWIRNNWPQYLAVDLSSVLPADNTSTKYQSSTTHAYAADYTADGAGNVSFNTIGSHGLVVGDYVSIHAFISSTWLNSDTPRLVTVVSSATNYTVAGIAHAATGTVTEQGTGTKVYPVTAYSVAQGVVASVPIVGGASYTGTPACAISGGTVVRNATCSSTLSSGAVTFTLTDPGAYTGSTVPTVAITGIAAGSGFVAPTLALAQVDQLTTTTSAAALTGGTNFVSLGGFGTTTRLNGRAGASDESGQTVIAADATHLWVVDEDQAATTGPITEAGWIEQLSQDGTHYGPPATKQIVNQLANAMQGFISGKTQTVAPEFSIWTPKSGYAEIMGGLMFGQFGATNVTCHTPATGEIEFCAPLANHKFISLGGERNVQLDSFSNTLNLKSLGSLGTINNVLGTSDGTSAWYVQGWNGSVTNFAASIASDGSAMTLYGTAPIFRLGGSSSNTYFWRASATDSNLKSEGNLHLYAGDHAGTYSVIANADNGQVLFAMDSAGSIFTLYAQSAATSGGNINSPFLKWRGNCWTGSASNDCNVVARAVPGSGSNPAVTLQFTQTGGAQSGSPTIQVANVNATASLIVNGQTATGVPLVAVLTTTAAASDNLTVTGMTSSGHCQLTPTNASAATNIATTYVSAKATNQITVTHTATASMTYDVLCTSY